MSAALTESIDGDAACARLEALGYAVLHGPDIAAGEPGDPNYHDVVPKTIISSEQRVMDADHQVEKAA